MPLFEYLCAKCERIFEYLEKWPPTIRECEICNTKLLKVISAPAKAHFKGEGFYETDYKKKPSNDN